MNLFLSVKDKVSLIIKIGEKSECSLQIIDEPDFSVLFCYESTHHWTTPKTYCLKLVAWSSL